MDLCCRLRRAVPGGVAGNSAFNNGIPSLEYAVAVLEVPLILVLGHSGCGAVKAAMGTKPLKPPLEDLVQPIRSSLKSDDDPTQVIEGNGRYAAGQVTKPSAVLKQAKASGKVMIKSVFFDIKSGNITLLD